MAGHGRLRQHPPGRGHGALDGLLGAPAAVAGDDTEYVLKGTGRLPLTDVDRVSLGAQAGRLPLLG
jgi:hypothetical protein